MLFVQSYRQRCSLSIIMINFEQVVVIDLIFLFLFFEQTMVLLVNDSDFSREISCFEHLWKFSLIFKWEALI